MRLNFPNTNRPKKTAKWIATGLGIPLSAAQRAISRACGYRDWHDLEVCVDAAPACALDQFLSSEAFVQRQASLCLAIADDLSVPDGDAQYALSGARLAGDRPIQLEEQIAIRIACWNRTTLPVVGARQRGAVGKLKTSGRNGEVVILRDYGRPSRVISHWGFSLVADFEYVSPRIAPKLFVPMRLYLPYGYWIESDGAKVIFSRDYKPMWRLRAGQPAERLDPWIWINFKEQMHFWDDAQTPWESPELKARLDAYLIENRLQSLPILADALPYLVGDTTLNHLNIADGAELLRPRLKRS